MMIELRTTPDGTIPTSGLRQTVAGQTALFPGVFDDEMVQDSEGEWVWQGLAAESTLPAEIDADLKSITTADLKASVARRQGRK